MTEQQKKFILSSLESIQADEIIEYLRKKQLSPEEVTTAMKNVGLSYEKQQEIRNYLSELGAEEKVEDNYFKECRVKGTRAAFNEYLRAYPNGKFVIIAESKITSLQENIEIEKNDVLERLRFRPDDCTPTYIENLIENGTITKDDLAEAGIITKDALEIYLSPPKIFSDQLSWSDLVALPIDHTDVYIFGIPRSGKSCVLAGVFHEASRVGQLSERIDNHKGVRYMNELIRSVECGYVPPSTTTDTVNYISCDLIRANGMAHPLSFIEMSGEYFRSTYELAGANAEGTIGAKGYLHNDNRKAIIFVIDYFNDTARSYQEKEDQQGLLMYCINVLDNDGTLENTDSIQIIVTKSDLMPKDMDQEEFTKIFLNDKYKRFLNAVQDKITTYSINAGSGNKTIFHNFSLGKFMLGKTYEFNNTSSSKLLKAITAISAPRKSTSWRGFKGLFIKKK